MARLARGDSGASDASRVGPTRTHAHTCTHAHVRTMQTRVRTHHSLCHCDCLCGACMCDSVSVKHLPPRTHPTHAPINATFRTGGNALRSPAPFTLGCQRLWCAGAACSAMRTCCACCKPRSRPQPRLRAARTAVSRSASARPRRPIPSARARPAVHARRRAALVRCTSPAQAVQRASAHPLAARMHRAWPMSWSSTSSAVCAALHCVQLSPSLT
jgi:hypothetical protein